MHAQHIVMAILTFAISGLKNSNIQMIARTNPDKIYVCVLTQHCHRSNPKNFSRLRQSGLLPSLIHVIIICYFCSPNKQNVNKYVKLFLFGHL